MKHDFDFTSAAEAVAEECGGVFSGTQRRAKLAAAICAKLQEFYWDGRHDAIVDRTRAHAEIANGSAPPPNPPNTAAESLREEARYCVIGFEAINRQFVPTIEAARKISEKMFGSNTSTKKLLVVKAVAVLERQTPPIVAREIRPDEFPPVKRGRFADDD